MDPPTCIKNCHIINGQIQMDAPGVLIFPPSVPSSMLASVSISSATPTSSTLSSATTGPILAGPVSSGAEAEEGKKAASEQKAAQSRAKSVVNSVARSCQGKCIGQVRHLSFLFRSLISTEWDQEKFSNSCGAM